MYPFGGHPVLVGARLTLLALAALSVFFAVLSLAGVRA